jgi:hypothetical protein
MTKALMSHLKLSESQRTAVMFDVKLDYRIEGPPGSGKTRALLHRASILKDSGRVSPEEYRIILSSEELAESNRELLEELDIPKSVVMTFAQWLIEYWNAVGLGPLPLLESGEPDLRNMLGCIFRLFEIRPLPKQFLNRYRFVMIDDAQDMDPFEIEIFRKLSNHVTVAAEDRFRLVDWKAPLKGICIEIRPGWTRTVLKGNFRNSKSVAKLGSEFGERLESSDQEALPIKPKYAVAGNSAVEMQLLALRLRFRDLEVGGRLEKVPVTGSRAVIVPNESAVDIVRKELDAGGFNTITALEAVSFNLGANDYSVAVLTYEKARGLTFDNVFLPTLSADHWQDLSPERQINMLFLGITRARRWVYLSGQEGFRSVGDYRLRTAAKKRVLIMKQYIPDEFSWVHSVTIKNGHYPEHAISPDGESTDS